VSSKFNSNRTLNKTPGVCHSERKEPAPPTDPPPPGTFPEAFYVNVEHTYDIGFGTQVASGMNVQIQRTANPNLFIGVYFLTSSRRGRAIMIWTPSIFLFRLVSQVSDLPPFNFSTVQIPLTLGPDPTPIILDQEKTLGFPNVPWAVWDVWT